MKNIFLFLVELASFIGWIVFYFKSNDSIGDLHNRYTVSYWICFAIFGATALTFYLNSRNDKGDKDK